jgi:hypothetical protein
VQAKITQAESDWTTALPVPVQYRNKIVMTAVSGLWITSKDGSQNHCFGNIGWVLDTVLDNVELDEKQLSTPVDADDLMKLKAVFSVDDLIRLRKKGLL